MIELSVHFLAVFPGKCLSIKDLQILRSRETHCAEDPRYRRLCALLPPFFARRIRSPLGGTPEPGLRADRVLEERLLLVGPPCELSAHDRHGINAAVSVPFSRLGDYPLILPAGLHGLRSLIYRFSASQETELQVIAEVNAIPELIALAAAGAGFTILSHASVQEEWRGGIVSCARIADKGFTRHVYLCRSATRPASLAVTTVWQRLLTITGRLVEGGQWPVHCFNAGGEGAGP